MSNRVHHKTGTLLFVCLAVIFAATPAAFGQDAGAPPWGEYLRRFKKDPLLKKPFHMSPESEVKGLSSKIRARELDIPNRKRAIRYLKDLDCTQFPEAKEMLLSLLDPEAEKWEEVRYEAAKGLRDMLARHSCNPDAGKDGSRKDGSSGQSGSCQSCQSGGCEDNLWQQCSNTAANAGKRLRGERTKPQEPACHCRSCCDAKTLNTLAKTAYEMKEDACCYEPSLRVREMAVEAIKACGVPCNYKPYYGETGEEPGPPAYEEVGGDKDDGNGVDEPLPPKTDENSVPMPDSASVPGRVPTLTMVTPISRLSNLCIVGLAHGQQLKPDPQFKSTYRGRIYYFASDEAKQEFNTDPERYAIAFGGCDPVHFVQTQSAVEGRFLTEHEGRFYMFATKENYLAFKASPERYAQQSSRSDSVAAN
jgi:YHS domain-containing protein